MSGRTVRLAGSDVPVIGQGTWRMGTDRTAEVAALRAGIDLGLTVIDTAELYADGAAEEVVGEAVRGRRDEVFLVSKVLPRHATTDGTVAACRASLDRLGTDRLDLYLLHWRRGIPLAETVAGFEELLEEGSIRAWGVSNLDVHDLDDLPDGAVPAADQVLYNLTRRGPEANLFPRCARTGVTIMAYSPVEKGRLLDHPDLVRVAAERGATPAQVALAWSVRRDDVVAVPKAVRIAHVEENAAALRLELTAEELAALDHAFPAPGVVPLETLS
ncbi:aldo/keto reductase [Actinomycetospora sp. TBRC 11914]|uniref:aldo/keto reductase n=1 Tax=Actinomycetospora sp. TBRC 11914 TaxID=2729387 RepID=UPI00145E9F79|nr:aldo/keto reductase [Actinomycetospora sp. TBRC 11914]NMO94037.1 aldo/keto reductase [Actinomycetospora sp. TBRC 11914]